MLLPQLSPLVGIHFLRVLLDIVQRAEQLGRCLGNLAVLQ